MSWLFKARVQKFISSFSASVLSRWLRLPRFVRPLRSFHPSFVPWTFARLGRGRQRPRRTSSRRSRRWRRWRTGRRPPRMAPSLGLSVEPFFRKLSNRSWTQTCRMKNFHAVTRVSCHLDLIFCQQHLESSAKFSQDKGDEVESFSVLEILSCTLKTLRDSTL